MMENNINKSIETISLVQSTKMWRLVLSYRRFVEQLIKGNLLEKKDFIKWMLKKIFKIKFHTKDLKDFDFLENAKTEIKSITYNDTIEVLNSSMLKNNKHIFIFAGVPYYDIGGGQRSAQIAKIFNRMGYCVDYIYAYESSESERVKITMPTNRHIYLKHINTKDITKNLRGEPIFIFEIPHKDFEQYLNLGKKIDAKIVYEHIDNWETQLGNLFFNEDVFKGFLRMSDVIIATSDLLREKLDGFILKNKLECSKVEYLANAVDSDLFDSYSDYKKPKDLVKAKKTLLYYGSLWGEWFDWNKVTYLAENISDCSINIIGDYKPIIDKIKNMPKNIHFLGLKEQKELPAYLYYCDLALLPFKNDDIGKYVSPLKIFEYIAMNKLVISTNLPDICGYPNVLCSDSKEEWVQFVNGSFNLSNSENFIIENNWYSRCNKILELVDKKNVNKKDMISIIILNRNNKDVINKCINNLLDFKENYNYEIIVVDNDSTDGSYEMIVEKYSADIKIIKNNKNGCSSGRNIGAKNSNGNIIVFLDSDQWPVSSRWLDIPISIIKNNTNIGAVGWAAGWFDRKESAGIIGDNLPNRGVSPAYLFRTDIGYLGTGGMVLKKDVFYQVNGFDEAYDPTCYEDTDFSLKIRNEGYELAYCPYICLKHLPHQTTNSGSKEHSDLLQKNGKYFFAKWKEKNPKLLEYYYD